MRNSAACANASWSPGFCEGSSGPGDCDGGDKGSWQSVATAGECVRLCRGCHRCGYVSHSADLGDCSWYTHCSMSHLSNLRTGHCTLEVDAEASARPSPRLGLGISMGFNPFVFVEPRTRRSAAILCLRPKAGSTFWVETLARARRDPAAQQTSDGFSFGLEAPARCRLGGARCNSSHYLPTPCDTLNSSTRFLRAHGELLLRDRRVTRVTIVRNPYSRLLSGYLEIMLGEEGALWQNASGWRRWLAMHSKPSRFRLGGSLLELARALVVEHHPNAHFKLQSSVCVLPDGREYDLTLRAEEADQWTLPLMRLLGLVDRSTATETPERVSRVHSDDKLQRYFDQELLQVVTPWVKPDLDAYGYLPWDGTGQPQLAPAPLPGLQTLLRWDARGDVASSPVMAFQT